MKYKFFSVLLAALLLLSLTACGITQVSGKEESLTANVAQAESSDQAEAPADEGSFAEDEAWKAEFEKSLLENYGVTPNHYEDLGDGVYQVYVEIDGNIVPFVTVDSATGDYHG